MQAGQAHAALETSEAPAAAMSERVAKFRLRINKPSQIYTQINHRPKQDHEIPKHLSGSERRRSKRAAAHRKIDRRQHSDGDYGVQGVRADDQIEKRAVSAGCHRQAFAEERNPFHSLEQNEGDSRGNSARYKGT